MLKLEMPRFAPDDTSPLILPTSSVIFQTALLLAKSAIFFQDCLSTSLAFSNFLTFARAFLRFSCKVSRSSSRRSNLLSSSACSFLTVFDCSTHSRLALTTSSSRVFCRLRSLLISKLRLVRVFHRAYRSLSSNSAFSDDLCNSCNNLNFYFSHLAFS